MVRYRNSFHNPNNPMYGPEFYERNAEPVEYRGYWIVKVLDRWFDIVKDGVCIHQYGSDRAAREIINRIESQKSDAGGTLAGCQS